MYNKTITICNKLKKADTQNNSTDLWIKTVIRNAEFKRVSQSNINGTAVSMGEAIVVLIPFGNGYLPYNEWKKDVTKGYTITQGDVVFLGMELDEIPTSANITALKLQYKPNVCEARVINVAENVGLTRVEVKIEGV
jgi:hypothetical protein